MRLIGNPSSIMINVGVLRMWLHIFQPNIWFRWLELLYSPHILSDFKRKVVLLFFTDLITINDTMAARRTRSAYQMDILPLSYGVRRSRRRRSRRGKRPRFPSNFSIKRLISTKHGHLIIQGPCTDARNDLYQVLVAWRRCLREQHPLSRFRDRG